MDTQRSKKVSLKSVTEVKKMQTGSGDWIVNLTKMGCIFSTSQLHEKKEVQYNTADPYTICCIGV